ncbi:MAG: MCE family protein [Proteobacteria bacterium]|nr:MCE family protein [Pseudomonadota bacterium]MBU1418010.1 MCE family protein [Pseudomonadota bacterium]MBU1455939.1 MCE family protein [Pseudomonadota bacterium]
MTSKKLQPALIGAFVFLSFFLFTVAILIFGGSKFFDKTDTVIAYFDGSLQGLTVGAPVTYRGVTIGRVKDIKIHIQTDDNQQHQIVIPVLISLIPGKSIISDGSDSSDENKRNDFLKTMCEQGLRAKLKLQSLVTGKLYIDLAIYANTTPVYHNQDDAYFEIPTLPSEMYQLSQVLENMNLGELYNKTLSTLNAIESLTTGLAQALHSEQTMDIITKLDTSTTSLDSILSQIDNRISPLLQNMDSSFIHINELAIHADQTITSFDAKMSPFIDDMTTTLSRLDTALQHADQLLDQAEKTIQPSSPLYFRLTEAMRQLEKTANSIQNLSTFLHRNPEALIYGLQKTGDAAHDQ